VNIAYFDPQFAFSPLIQSVNSQNGGFAYLQKKALQRILKITWFEHLTHTISLPPLALVAGLVSGFFFGIGLARANP
jgi:hypothetical protein